MEHNENGCMTVRDKLNTHGIFEGQVPGSEVMCEYGIELSMEERFFIDAMLSDEALKIDGPVEGVQVRRSAGDTYNIWLMKNYQREPQYLISMCNAIKERVNSNGPERLRYIIITPTTDNRYYNKHLQYKKNDKYVTSF